MALFETFVGMLADFAPILSFFSRSKKLFEQMDSEHLEAAVEAVCKEMVLFCLGVVRYCQRNPVGRYTKIIPDDGSLILASKPFPHAIPAQSGGGISTV
jgi:hypothetical protein